MPGYPGYYPQPTTIPPPASPPPTGPLVPTTTIFFGPTTTAPRPTSTTQPIGTPFRCYVEVFSSGTQQTPAVVVSVTAGNKSAAWVVVTWGATVAEKGVQLSDGAGATEFSAPSRTAPNVEVYADNLKRPSDLGCTA